jgi:hypothetical protein
MAVIDHQIESLHHGVLNLNDHPQITIYDGCLKNVVYISYLLAA